jgi:hypothetical protein
MARSDRRPCANLLREFFSCSTLTFAALFTAIERPIATSAQGTEFSYRAFGGISARKQAQAWTSTIASLSAGSGLFVCERRRRQLLANIAYMSVFGHRRSYDEATDDLLVARRSTCRHTNVKWISGQMMVLTPLRPGSRAAIASPRIEANSERRETAFQLDGTILSTLSGIELGFDSSLDLNGESSLWKFVRTRSHAEVRYFAL